MNILGDCDSEPRDEPKRAVVLPLQPRQPPATRESSAPPASQVSPGAPAPVAAGSRAPRSGRRHAGPGDDRALPEADALDAA